MNMHKLNLRNTPGPVAAAILGVVGLMWGWNTLTELFDWPAATLRHALAAIVVAAILRSLAMPRSGRHGPAGPRT
jgi:uncharacterized membrane protein YhhN